jgi:hypothetical protein
MVNVSPTALFSGHHNGSLLSLDQALAEGAVKNEGLGPQGVEPALICSCCPRAPRQFHTSEELTYVTFPFFLFLCFFHFFSFFTSFLVFIFILFSHFPFFLFSLLFFSPRSLDFLFFLALLLPFPFYTPRHHIVANTNTRLQPP